MPNDHDTFRDWQTTVGWSNRKLADRLGVSERTVDNYRSGAVSIPRPVMMLMPILVRDELRARKG